MVGRGKFQSLSVTFTLRTSLQDVLGRPYMMSCIFFFILLTEYMDYKVVLIINDDAIPQTLIFIVGLSVMLQISKFWQSPKDVLMRYPVTFLQHSKAAIKLIAPNLKIIHAVGFYFLSPRCSIMGLK